MTSRVDTVVLGGGFYGCEIALKMRQLGHPRVLLVERRRGFLERASFVNQARVHNGYHYPRSIATAARSHMNFERFLHRYNGAVLSDMRMIYAIARGSRVSASQFVRFCATIGLPCDPLPSQLLSMFDSGFIEDAFLTREFAFDAGQLSAILEKKLRESQVEVRLDCEGAVLGADETSVHVRVGEEIVHARFVFNCTYSDLPFAGIGLQSSLKRELTEILLIRPPRILEGLGVTVMDGPFFSTMPFPAAGLHSLSHVRYTPHWAVTDEVTRDLVPTRTNALAMLRDASHFLPCLESAQPIRSLFEVKAVLARNENDDGRPILIEQSRLSPRIYSILGSKIDNIFDALEYIGSRDWAW